MKEFSIDRNTEGQRIDRYLSDELEDRSRSYIQKIMKEGYVKVNQKPVKSNYRLSFGDSVEVTLPEAKEPDIVPENSRVERICGGSFGNDKKQAWETVRRCFPGALLTGSDG